MIEQQLRPQKDCVDWVCSTRQKVEREIPVATREDQLETRQVDRSANVFVFGNFAGSYGSSKTFGGCSS